MTRALFVIAVLTAAAAALSCDDPTDPYVPTPGELVVVLATPHDDDGALVLRIAGPEIGAVNAIAGLHAVSRSADGEARVALFGLLAEGPVLRFAVPDLAQVDGYAATVLEVADTLNEVRDGVGAYALTITSP